MADVTDATFATDVVERSHTVPVVVDLWADWCGPCKTLGPILEKVIGETQGLVELAKVDVEANPVVAGAFQVQSIPAVYAMKDGAIVDGFMGAVPESEVVAFVQRLLDGTAGNVSVEHAPEEAPAVESEAQPTISEPAPAAEPPAAAPTLSPAEGDAIEAQLVELLPQVKGDEEARATFLELLDRLGPDDPRTNAYRRKLATALF